MKLLILVATFTALASARPETYKETEDFQYSRSSSDDGHKSGYYGAQRGNMGGNYERAHNMDSLAQNQMSGLIRQVDGELGEGSNTKTGSVYTAANSRGVYGSGKYDLANLKGRNFGEGLNSDSQSRSSTYQNAGYGNQYSSSDRSGYRSSQSHNSRYNTGYQATGGEYAQTDQLQAADTLHAANQYEYGNQAASNSRQHSQSTILSQTEIDQNNRNLHSSSGYGSSSQNHLIAVPVKVVMRPGGRVAIPISAQTYDNSRSTNSYGMRSSENRDTEELSNMGQVNHNQPKYNGKHYESSYSYNKHWEKHDTIPVTVSSVATIPVTGNGQLYDDAQLLQSSKNQFQNSFDSNVDHSSSMQSAHSASSSRSRLSAEQSNSDAQQQSLYNYNDYNSGAAVTADSVNQIDNINSKPKNYQSSYSYHKSWERQGDPYVIKPAGVSDGQTSQRLTAASASNNAGYSTHQYSSQNRQAHQSYSQNGGAIDCDCDEYGRVRVRRSYHDQEAQEDLGQQLQSGWENIEDLGQHTQNKLENLEDMGQQVHRTWDNLEDLGQQSQNKWDQLKDLDQHQQTQNKWDNLQDLGQQTQNQWGNLQELGQQTQNNWDNLGQETQDFAQQTQSGLEQETQKELNFNQQIQNGPNNYEQKTQHEESNNMQSAGGLEQETQQELESFGQQLQPHEQMFSIGQNSHHLQRNDHTFSFGQNSQSHHPVNSQESQTQQELENFGQQQQHTDNVFSFGQYSESYHPVNTQEQQTQQELENFGQQQTDLMFSLGQNSQSNPPVNRQEPQTQQELENVGQQQQQTDHMFNFGQDSESNHPANSQFQQSQKELDHFGQHSLEVGHSYTFEQHNIQSQSKELTDDKDKMPQQELNNFGQKSENYNPDLLPNIQNNNDNINHNVHYTHTFENNNFQHSWSNTNYFNQDKMRHEHQTSYNHNPGFEWHSNGPRKPNQWTMYNHQHHSYNWNSDNFTDSHKSQNEFNNHKPNPLENLWNKIHNIAKEQLENNDSNENDEDKKNKDHNTQIHEQNAQHEIFEVYDITPTTEKSFLNRDRTPKSTSSINTTHRTTVKSTTSLQDTSKPSTTIPTVTQKATPTQSIDIGRGDIGPEDISDEIINHESGQEAEVLHLETDSKYKTPEQIEYLSLKEEPKVNENILQNQSNEREFNNNVNIQNLNDPEKKKSESQKSNDCENKETFIPIISQTSSNTGFAPSSNLHNKEDKDEVVKEHIQQENLEQQNENYGQEFERWHDQSTLEHFGQLSWQRNETTSNTEQKLSVLGVNNLQKQTSDLQHSTTSTSPETSIRRNYEEINYFIPFESQHSSDRDIIYSNYHNINNVDQKDEIQSIHQQNVEQQFENYGQQLEDLQTQSTKEHFGEQTSLWYPKALKSNTNFKQRQETYGHNKMDFDQYSTNWQPKQVTQDKVDTEPLDMPSQSALEDFSQQVYSVYSYKKETIPDKKSDPSNKELSRELIRNEQTVEQKYENNKEHGVQELDETNIQQEVIPLNDNIQTEKPMEIDHQFHDENYKIPLNQNNLEIPAPAEPTTEKTFWNKVGKSFTSAKDKVYSWFKS